MNKHMEWLKVLAIIIFMTLMGGYYDQLSVETRTMILPLAIFIVATYFFVCLRKMQYQIRASNVNAYKLVANELSLTDSNGHERISITADNGVVTFFSENHVPRAKMDMLGDNPLLKLKTEEGSAELAFHQEGMTRITLRDKTDNVIWSAP